MSRIYIEVKKEEKINLKKIFKEYNLPDNTEIFLLFKIEEKE